jgi:adenylate cyclase
MADIGQAGIGRKVGKTEPQRIFELLGRKGEVARERLPLRDAYVETLDAYRRKDWEKALAGFEDCLAIVPCDAPSKLFLERRSVSRHRPYLPSGMASGRWWRSRHRGAAASGLPKKPLVPRTR